MHHVEELENSVNESKSKIIMLMLRIAAFVVLAVGAVILSLRQAWLAVGFCILLIVLNLILTVRWLRLIDKALSR